MQDATVLATTWEAHHRNSTLRPKDPESDDGFITSDFGQTSALSYATRATHSQAASRLIGSIPRSQASGRGRGPKLVLKDLDGVGAPKKLALVLITPKLALEPAAPKIRIPAHQQRFAE